MSHLLSKNSNKGSAINALLEKSKNTNVKIIGIGDSPNDLPLLKSSDLKIVISGINGPNQKLLDDLKEIDISVSDKPHGYGWKEEVLKAIFKLNNN